MAAVSARKLEAPLVLPDEEELWLAVLAEPVLELDEPELEGDEAELEPDEPDESDEPDEPEEPEPDEEPVVAVDPSAAAEPELLRHEVSVPARTVTVPE